jgi:hypothetical protein
MRIFGTRPTQEQIKNIELEINNLFLECNIFFENEWRTNPYVLEKIRQGKVLPWENAKIHFSRKSITEIYYLSGEKSICINIVNLVKLIKSSHYRIITEFQILQIIKIIFLHEYGHHVFYLINENSHYKVVIERHADFVAGLLAFQFDLARELKELEFFFLSLHLKNPKKSNNGIYPSYKERVRFLRFGNKFSEVENIFRIIFSIKENQNANQ